MKKTLVRSVVSIGFMALLLGIWGEGAQALTVSSGELTLVSSQEETVEGKTAEMVLRFTPGDGQLLDSFRLELTYDAACLTLSSSRPLDDNFNGSLDLADEEGVVSMLYLAEYDDTMRQSADLLTLRFAPKDTAYTGNTDLLLSNKETGEQETVTLTYTAKAVSVTSDKAASSKPSGTAGTAKASSSANGSKAVSSSDTSKKEDASSLVIAAGASHKQTNLLSNVPDSILTVLLAAAVVAVTAMVAVALRNKKRGEKSPISSESIGEREENRKRDGKHYDN